MAQCERRVGGDQGTRSAVVREISKLRAQRAARIAREAAAGQRRMLAAGLLALVTIGIAVAIPVAQLAWPWIFAGAAPLVAVIGWSRHAAVKSEKAGAAEVARLRKLRDQQAAVRTEAREGKDVVVDAPSVEVGRAESGRASDVEDVRDESVDAPEARVEAASADVEAEADSPDVEAEVPATKLTWSVTPIPAPTYASRERVKGRDIRVDTDLRGIPQVAKVGPARPVSAQPLPASARSTEDVVATEAVALSLDAVLDARRAQ